MGKNDLVVREPTLPGLMPERPMADLLAIFEVDVDSNYKIVANKLPTSVQREMLQKRNAELQRVLTPASASAQAQTELIGIIAMWLGGFPLLAHADNVGMAKAYADHLKALPLFAVARAIRSIKDRTAKKIDKNGREAKLDPDDIPSSGRVYDLAKKEMAAADAEKFKIDRLLAARGTMDVEIDEAMRERVKEKMMALADDMKRGTLLAPKLRREMIDENDAALRRREAAVAESNLARDRMILGEYARLGLEPQYAAPGVLVSPALARHRAPKAKGNKKGARR